jgi:predicted RNA-binding protein YlxR (DUF448 family)
MQEALKKVGLTEEYLAGGIIEGTRAIDGTVKVIRVAVNEEGDEVEIRPKPDHRTRGIYFKLGAELLDAFPAKKSIEAQVGVETLLDEAENGAEYAEWKKNLKEKSQ